jgi:hypothetical protein
MASTMATNPLPAPCLVADIGGTHARFGLVDGPGRPVTQVQRLRADEHAQLADAVRAYLAMVTPPVGAPRRACFAVATPLDGDAVAFTNSRWRFSRSALQQALGLSELHLLNDFEALALALPRLTADGLRAHGPLPAPRGTRAVVGPGTGLGVAGLIDAPAGWLAVPGEGGRRFRGGGAGRRALRGCACVGRAAAVGHRPAAAAPRDRGGVGPCDRGAGDRGDRAARRRWRRCRLCADAGGVLRDAGLVCR